MMDDAAPIRVDMVERDPEAYSKLRALRDHLLRAHVCGWFTDAADLAGKAERALRETRRRMQR